MLTLARAVRLSYRLFPEQAATITVKARPWWSGMFVSHLWASEWADAYRPR